MLRRFLPLVYLVVGLLVAAQHGYLGSLTTASKVISAVLAVVLWPLVLFGVHLTIA